ncbi:MAG TPA: SPOR domain-containing protein [Bacteroidales bacterium]
MKKSLLWVLTLCLVFGLGACKSKQSAYKAAFEKAKEKEVAVVEEEETATTTTATARPITNATFQKESLQAVEGELKTFSVVIGSFQSRSNATGLKAAYEAKGYTCAIAMNTEKQMYRVIVGSFNNKNDAADLRDLVKEKHNLSDAWLLEKK